MTAKRLAPLRAITSRFVPLLVLAILAGIGWWGHTFHWDLAATFAALGGSSSAHAKGTDPHRESTSTREPRGVVPVSGELPPVVFKSADGARDCGILSATVEERSMDDFVVANAVVGYDQTRLAQLAVRVPGTVSKVEKHLGDTVERGDPLVIVDAAEVGDAKAKLLEACVVHKLKTQNVQRLKQVKDAIAGRDLVEAEAACELSRTQRFNALQKLINLGFTLKIEDIESLSADQLAERLHVLGLPSSFDASTASYNLIPLVAPFTGVVTKCEVVRGETVEPSNALYVLADVRRMWLHLSVRPDDAARIKIGTQVTFESEMKSSSVTGKLTWIGTEIDPKTRTIQARAEVENLPLDGASDSDEGSRVLQAGAYGAARILIRSQPAVLVVPNEALHWQWEIGQEIVFLANDDACTFTPRVVKKGLERDGYVQVLAGLAPDARVVTAGSRILSGELSEHLQAHLGDNSEGVRNFHHAAESKLTPE